MVFGVKGLIWMVWFVVFGRVSGFGIFGVLDRLMMNEILVNCMVEVFVVGGVSIR